VKKSSGQGAVSARSHGDGSLAVPPLDRQRGGIAAQRKAIPEGVLSAELNRRALAETLDGEVERTSHGFAATTAERVLHVPYSLAADAAEALLITKTQGLLTTKLDRMQPEMAWIVYMLTLPSAQTEN
jgi:hypothetical protein